MAQVKILPLVWQAVLGCVLLLEPLSGAFEYPGLGWAAAAANIKVVGAGHLDRYSCNPALLTGFSGTQLLLDLQRPYAGLDLQATMVAAAVKFKRMPLFTSLSFFGDAVYSETQATAGISRSLNPGIHLGATLSYGRVQLLGKTCAKTLSLSPALVVDLSTYLQIGSVLHQLIQFQEGESREQGFSFGLAFSNGGLQLLTSLEKTGGLPAQSRYALVQSLGSRLQIAAGYSLPEGTFSCGWRLHFKHFSVHYARQGHPQLPDSQGLGMELTLP